MVHLTILHPPKSRMACHQGAHCPASNHLANPAIRTMKCKISTSILFKIRWDYHPHNDHWLKITRPKRRLVFQPSKPHLDCSKSRRSVSSLKDGVYFCQVFVGFQWVPSLPQHDMITFALLAASKWFFFMQLDVRNYHVCRNLQGMKDAQQPVTVAMIHDQQSKQIDDDKNQWPTFYTFLEFLGAKFLPLYNLLFVLLLQPFWIAHNIGTLIW